MRGHSKHALEHCAFKKLVRNFSQQKGRKTEEVHGPQVSSFAATDEMKEFSSLGKLRVEMSTVFLKLLRTENLSKILG